MRKLILAIFLGAASVASAQQPKNVPDHGVERLKQINADQSLKIAELNLQIAQLKQTILSLEIPLNQEEIAKAQAALQAERERHAETAQHK